MWPDEAPEGKLDLLMTIDFRMTQLDDLLRRRAAGGHLVREARPQRPPTCTPSSTPSTRPSRRRGRRRPTGRRGRSIAKRFSELAVDHLGTRRDVVAKPLWHDTPEAMATEHGVVKDWRTGEVDPVPGQDHARASRSPSATTPPVYEKMTSIGPLLEKVGMLTKGVRVRRQARGRHPPPAATAWPTAAPATASPRLETDIHMADAILHLSGTTNGHLATHGLQDPREAHRHRAARPRRRARGQADHLRRHPGRARCR